MEVHITSCQEVILELAWGGWLATYNHRLPGLNSPSDLMAPFTRGEL